MRLLFSRSCLAFLLAAICACHPAKAQTESQPGEPSATAVDRPSSTAPIQGMDPYHCFPSNGDFAGIVSETRGVDFCYYVKVATALTREAWVPLIPREVNSPIFKTGEVVMVFTILPDGHLDPSSIKVQQSSGDAALDRASRGAIETAVFRPLPIEYKGPGLTLSFHFYYNVESPNAPPSKAQMTPRTGQKPGILTVGYNWKLCCANNKAHK
jgi:TonB family protein